jgi:hypothetical protein
MVTILAKTSVLDDFGEQSTNPWVKEKLYQLINYRYNSRLPIVITTRLSLDEIMNDSRKRRGNVGMGNAPVAAGQMSRGQFLKTAGIGAAQRGSAPAGGPEAVPVIHGHLH